ncbi:MAG: hypothetical protein GKR85_10010 [Candidatus Nanopelagicales bacterium]|nr:hypothetical protein [Candidatus Nanopelagicales bacterium]
MRLVTGAALAAALLLTGCGTQVDPFQDDEADALEVAWQACEVWMDFSDDDYAYGTQQYHINQMIVAGNAGGLASQAAYLDPRWRTLADAFPYLVPFHELSAADAAFAEDGDTLREELRDQAALWGVYTNVTYQECEAVYVLRGDRESFYDKFFADPQGDPDTE